MKGRQVVSSMVIELCDEFHEFFFIFIAQKVSNIHLVTKDFKIVPLTTLLKLQMSHLYQLMHLF